MKSAALIALASSRDSAIHLKEDQRFALQALLRYTGGILSRHPHLLEGPPFMLAISLDGQLMYGGKSATYGLHIACHGGTLDGVTWWPEETSLQVGGINAFYEEQLRAAMAWQNAEQKAARQTTLKLATKAPSKTTKRRWARSM